MGAIIGSIQAIVALFPDDPAKSPEERISDLRVGLDVDLFERTLGDVNRVTTYSGDSKEYGPGIYPAEGGVAKELKVRIYKLDEYFIQTGANRGGTVVAMIVQSCNPENKLKLPRSHTERGEPVVLNQTRLKEMSSTLPERASYNVPASNPSEFLEFSEPWDGVGAVWGAGPGCESQWVGRGREPIISWHGNRSLPELLSLSDAPRDPIAELLRFRKGKTINLYGEASPVYDSKEFPLLSGHGAPREIVSHFDRATRQPK
ncbi:hypothetical protein ACFWBR_24330 [Streptomyces sp. NPDC060006]|uniref:hypothetical protein n=1 Tax=unclassified Streptomyces TaxID=2593676 RepID=UPI0036BF2F03